MKIAKTPPGGAGTDANSHGLQVLFEDFENSCFMILSRRLLLTKHFRDKLTVIWLSWPTWINRSTNLFPTLPRGTHASLLLGLPPLQWVCSPAEHGKCETASWNTFCFLTIISHIPGQCCGQVEALLCRVLRWTSVQRKLYLNLSIINTELCGQCARTRCADERVLKTIKQKKPETNFGLWTNRHSFCKRIFLGFDATYGDLKDGKQNSFLFLMAPSKNVCQLKQAISHTPFAAKQNASITLHFWHHYCFKESCFIQLDTLSVAKGRRKQFVCSFFCAQLVLSIASKFETRVDKALRPSGSHV